jgi:hypothetical protein
LNTASFVTRSAYAKQLRQGGADLATLARLQPPTGGERQTYRDLLTHLKRIHAFFERNESRLIVLDSEPGDSINVIRRTQRVLRPIAADSSAVLDDISVLHLDECQLMIGL